MEERKMIAVPSRTKEILEQFDLRAKKGYGQNFLVDPMIVKRVAEEAHCQGGVIEIGPGLGALSEALAMVAPHVVCYEVDPDMLEVLRVTLADYPNVELILQDFLEVDLHAKVEELYNQYGQVTVCANLPYYITTPVLFKLFQEEKLSHITVMVQKEVGDRFAAPVGDPNYSALSIEGQYLYQIKKLFTVPGRSFNPSPAVDSIILQFTRKQQLPSLDEKEFFEFVRLSFQQRRKTLYNNLKDAYPNIKEALQNAHIDERKRGQELSVSQFVELFNILREGEQG